MPPTPEKSNERDRVVSDFPKFSLEGVISIAAAIENTNGGKPLPPILTFAIGKSPGISAYRVLFPPQVKSKGVKSGGTLTLLPQQVKMVSAPLISVSFVESGLNSKRAFQLI
jgi:hypothetical protein